MVRSLRRSKNAAFFFIVDTLIGILIFVTTVFIIAGFNSIKPSGESTTQQLDLISKDVFDTELRFVDITSDFFLDLKQDTENYNPFLTIDEFTYLLYLQGNVANATNLIANLTDWLVPSYGLNYSIFNGSDYIPIYYRESSMTSFENSRSSISREKVTIVSSNISTYIPPVFSLVVIWR